MPPVGNALQYISVPIGTILMFYGDPTALTPGWSLCDGNIYNNIQTPDLRSKFIVGASDIGTKSEQAINYELGDTGGSNTVELKVENLPSHSHSINHKHIASQDKHSHLFQLYGSGSKNGAYEGNDSDPESGSMGITDEQAPDITVEEYDGSSSSVGSDTAHENRPPYFALYYIIRTA